MLSERKAINSKKIHETFGRAFSVELKLIKYYEIQIHFFIHFKLAPETFREEEEEEGNILIALLMKQITYFLSSIKMISKYKAGLLLIT